MRRSKQHSRIRVQSVVAAILAGALCATVAVAAYNDDQDSQQSWQQQQSQNRQQSSMPSQDQDSWQQQQGQRSGMSQARNQQIERQVADELRQEGFGQEGQIMVLATGNHVILLGTVPDQQQKDQIEQATNQVSGVQQVDNRLHVSTGAGRQNDSQLQQQIQQQLQSRTSAGQNVQVQARNGRVTLSGQVDNWQAMADVLEAAFAAGAQNVSSQLTTSQGQSQMGRGYQSRMGQDQWRSQQQDTGRSSQMDRGYYPPYGYTPGQDDQSQWQNQPGYDQQQRQGRMQQGRQQWGQQQQWDQQSGMGMQQPGGPQVSASDLALAQRIAMQLQQQLGTDKTVHVVDPRAIYVHVSQGTVKLHGAVQDNNQRQQAEQIVRSIRGVQNVQNQLQIAGQGEEYQTFGYVPGQMGRSQGQGRSQWDSSSRQGQSGTMGNQSDRSPWDNTGGQSQTGDMSDQSGQSQWDSRSSSQNQFGGRSDQSSSSQGQTSGSGQGQSGSPSDQSRSGTTSGQGQYGSTSGQSGQSGMGAGQSPGTSASRSSSSAQQQSSGQQGQGGTGDYPALGYIPGQDRQQRQQMGQRQGGANDKILAHQIAMELQQQLSSNQMIYVMDPDALYVHVAQGTVKLHGSVDDQNQKDQVEQTIWNIRGVQNVRNNVTIGGQTGDYPALGYIPGQEGQTTQHDAMQPDAGTGIAGDTQCIQVFKQGLTSQNLQGIAQNVYVTCHQGKMALYGYVKSNEEKDQLEKATKSVSGIKDVDSNLIVRKEGWPQKSDSEIQQDVESQLWWSPYVDSDKIHVTVQNGVVSLTGQADDWDAMRAAVKNAYDGVAKRVKSQIQNGQACQQPATDKTTTDSSSGAGGTTGTGSSSGTGGSSGTSGSSGTGGSSDWQ